MTDKKNKPNIIFIFSDQHRADSMACVGHPVVITPNMDNLASEGVVFNRCYTNSPLCVPARNTIASGLYVSQHGAWNNVMQADRNGQSHIRNIRDAGYHTAVIGKTHLLERYDGHVKYQEHKLNDWGYEDVTAIGSTVNTGRVDNAWTDYLEEKGLRKEYSKSIKKFLRLNWGFKRKPWEDPPAPLPVEAHIDNFVGRKAVEWIENYDEKKPFYLQVCFPGPHPPFNSSPEYRALYKPEDMPLGILEMPKKPHSMLVDFVLKWSNLGDMTPEQMQLLRSFYYAKITMIDERIGDIIESLKKRDMLKNTWIIYSSDHGENLGDHFMSQKVVFFESALKVPLIIRPPGGIKGWQSNALTDHLDVVSTMLDISKAKALEISNGNSLLKNINLDSSDPKAHKGKEVIFSEVYGYSMVFDGQYKFAVDANTLEPVEMIDIKQDPQELFNKVNDPSLGAVRENLLETHIKPLLKKKNIKMLQECVIKREEQRKLLLK